MSLTVDRLLAALVGGHLDFLAGALTDPDRVVLAYALRGARTLPRPDSAIEAAYEDACAPARATATSRPTPRQP